MLPQGTPMIHARPFRAPHHTISHAGLVGGGRQPRPGEITLSHRGVLFLDELPEFAHSVLESIRQPLEDRMVTVSRAQGNVTFPANFMLMAAMNPCPCGYYGDTSQHCTCSESSVTRYQHRISGPLLDRIDIFVDVPRVDYEKLTDGVSAEGSAEVRDACGGVPRTASGCASRNRGCRRTRRWGRWRCGSSASGTWTTRRERCCSMAVNQLALSARAFHRVLKVSRTIADLAQLRDDRGGARGGGAAVPAARAGLGRLRRARAKLEPMAARLASIEPLRPMLEARPLGIFSDIDGTLAPIVANPEDARDFAARQELLERLIDARRKGCPDDRTRRWRRRARWPA